MGSTGWADWTATGVIATILTGLISAFVVALRMHFFQSGRIDTLVKDMSTLTQAVNQVSIAVVSHEKRTEIHRDPERDGERWRELLAKIDGYQEHSARQMEQTNKRLDALHTLIVEKSK